MGRDGRRGDQGRPMDRFPALAEGERRGPLRRAAERSPRHEGTDCPRRAVRGGELMARSPKITRVEIHEIAWEVRDLGRDYNGFNQIYHPGNVLKSRGHVLRIETDTGIAGEYGRPIGGDDSAYAQVRSVAPYLIGKNPLQRELIYYDIKRGL